MINGTKLARTVLTDERTAALIEAREAISEMRNHLETFGQYGEETARVALDGAVDTINELIGEVAAQAGQVAVPGWVDVDERLPDVPANDYREFIVSCKRANGKSYVFAAHYLNQKMLPSRWPDDDEPEEGLPCTGWHHEAEVDGDNVFTEACESGDAVTHWMQLPAAPSPAKESK